MLNLGEQDTAAIDAIYADVPADGARALWCSCRGRSYTRFVLSIVEFAGRRGSP
jgi:hypothetical protein